MIGQHSPLSALEAFKDKVRALAARVSELERALSTPFIPAGYVTSAPTDGSGFLIVNHGLSFTPSAILATPRSTNHTQNRVDQITDTQFRYRAWNAAGTPVASESITFQWIAAR